MTGLVALWLPILLSAVAVFVVSSIIHMALPWHKSDYPQLPNEAKVLDALRPFAIAPGEYFMPKPASSADMRTPAFQEKMKQGPVVIMTVLPNGPGSMGTRLVTWLVYCVVVGAFAAYVAHRTLSPGAMFNQVACVTGVVSFVGYGVGIWQQSIWYSRPWMTTFKLTVDAVVYAAVTGAMFGWRWPAA
jgi:hypothetical protein